VEHILGMLAAGNNMVIWRDGKTEKIPADQIELREHQAGCKSR